VTSGVSHKGDINDVQRKMPGNIVALGLKKGLMLGSRRRFSTGDKNEDGRVARKGRWW
jgi:hypothetical protein